MTDLTLNDLFFGNASDPEAGEAAESILDEGDDSLAALKTELQQQLPKVSFKAVEKEIAAKVGEVLDVGLEELLGSSWAKCQAFQEYADPAQHPPEETILVPLAEHTIQSSHNPRVDVIIKNVVIGSISLAVRLAVALEGVVLKIQAGKILDIQAGSCQAAGTLAATLTSKVGSKELLKLEKETPKFELRGALQLGNGVAIPRLPAPAAE